MDVGGVLSPGEKVALGGHQVVPSLVAGQSVGVEIREDFWSDVSGNFLLNFVTAGPDVLQEHILALGVLTDALGLEVDVDGTGQSVGDDQRRRGQVVGAGNGVDTALEVSVSGKDGSNDEILSVDSVGHFVGDLTGVTNACHAAVTSGGEPELVKVLTDARAVQVARDDTGARRQGSLQVAGGLETLLDGISGQHTGLEHD